MTDGDVEGLRQENAYLKSRCAQLQGDVIDLTGELGRLRSQYERAVLGRSAPPPNPIRGGQS